MSETDAMKSKVLQRPCGDSVMSFELLRRVVGSHSTLEAEHGLPVASQAHGTIQYRGTEAILFLSEVVLELDCCPWL